MRDWRKTNVGLFAFLNFRDEERSSALRPGLFDTDAYD